MIQNALCSADFSKFDLNMAETNGCQLVIETLLEPL